LPFTKGKVTVINNNEVEIIVAGDANAAIPKLIESCKQVGLSVKKIEKKTPAFEEVFIHLIEGQANYE
jgi:acylphosphatase